MNKNGNKLLDKISDLDPKLISDAEKKPRAAKRRLFIGITSGMATAAAAAVIAVAAAHNPLPTAPVVSTSAPVISDSVSDPVSNSGSTIDSSDIPGNPATLPQDPPKLDFSKYKDLPKIMDRNTEGGQGGGRTSYLNHSDLEERGPWNGKELETMPVFMSHSTELDPDLDRMYARVREAAAALGLPADSLEITDNYQDLTESIETQRKMAEEAGATKEEIEEVINRMIRGSMASVNAQTYVNGIRISVDTAYRTYIYFEEEPIKLPDEYNFSKDATAEEKAAALSYLSDKYKDLIKFSKPAAGDGSYGFSIYDADCDLTQQIINYGINDVRFDISEGKLSDIDISSDGACEKLADYPILTAAQAEAILKSNKYDDNTRMPANAKILKTDMVYKNGAGYTAVMPYYEFYVESAEEPYGEYDTVCDVYTIPAVPEEFIDMETEDYGAHA